MCWSFEVSVGFALLEAIGIAFIAYRAKKSKNPFVRAQSLSIPGLVGIMCVEICEAIIWLDDNLIRIDAPIEGYGERPCSTWNKRLTFVLWVIIIPSQPMCTILPLRYVGDRRNKDILAIPAIMSIVYVVLHWFCHFMAYLTAKFDFNYEPEPPRQRIQDMNYASYGNSETCSYIGPYGHLFWTLQLYENWITPTGNIYSMLSITTLYARPWRMGGIFGLPMLVFNCLLGFYYNFSIEAASVWCWTGISLHTWMILQPYLFPCGDDEVVENNSVLVKKGQQQDADSVVSNMVSPLPTPVSSPPSSSESIYGTPKKTNKSDGSATTPIMEAYDESPIHKQLFNAK